MSGIVYIFTNPEMPDLVKIGTTKNLKGRLRKFYDTNVPVPFECYFACEVKDGPDVEKRLHSAFGDHRINPRREFFRISPERVKVILEALSLKDVTPASNIIEDESEPEVLKRSRSRAPAFRFSMVGIQQGAKLKFIKDETHTCCVVSDSKVEFEDQVGFLSPVTQNLLNNKFGMNWPSARGSDYWLYEGETLTERRLRMEGEGDD